MEPAALLLPPQARPAPATVEIVVPVHNEEADLERSIRRLCEYLDRSFPFSWLVTIADNASTDATWAIAERLACELDDVEAIHLDEKGRGRALRRAWSTSPSPVVAYMDVDLSTNLDALLPLVAPLVSGHSDIAIGSRLAPGARVVRAAGRELISRSYNLLLRTSLRSGFSDAQCGFKALRADVAAGLLPLVEDQAWFFDTELLVVAERNGLRIHEVPVDWVDDPDSRVDVIPTARNDLLGIARMLRSAVSDRSQLTDRVAGRAPASASMPDQLARFASIGIVSTLLFGLLLAVLAGSVGFALADLLALAACSVANTAANRRLTFAVGGSRRLARQFRDGLVLAALPLVTTLAVIATTGGCSFSARVVAVTTASATAASARFALLSRWIFR